MTFMIYLTFVQSKKITELFKHLLLFNLFITNFISFSLEDLHYFFISFLKLNKKLPAVFELFDIELKYLFYDS